LADGKESGHDVVSDPCALYCARRGVIECHSPMRETTYVKTECQQCKGHIEYPSELAGQSVECPHCKQTTTLPTSTPPLQTFVGLPRISYCSSSPRGGSMHSKAHYCFIVENGEQTGPFPPSKVQRMWRDGEITDAALVWREGLTDWQPIGSILPRLATIRQKEHLNFLSQSTTREMTFEEAQSQLDALVRDNPAKKLALERWHVLAQKRDEVMSYFERSQTKCPISDFDVVATLETIEASNPKQFAYMPSYEIARIFESHRTVRE
jgi:GYF domain 2